MSENPKKGGGGHALKDKEAAFFFLLLLLLSGLDNVTPGECTITRSFFNLC